MSSDLLDLAARVEALTEPSREVDAEIKEAAGHAWDYAAHPYTASLDAAMTLVPEGIGSDLLYVRTERLHTGKGRAVLLDTLGGQESYADAATPALALCAAALRARATLAQGADQ